MSLGPIISRLFTCSNVEKNKKKIKTKGACSSPISMIQSNLFYYVIMLSVITLSVIMLIVIILIVLAPYQQRESLVLDESSIILIKKNRALEYKIEFSNDEVLNPANGAASQNYNILKLIIFESATRV